jgi:enterobactin synthetase component D
MDEISQLISAINALPGPCVMLAGGIVSDDTTPVNRKEFEQVASAGAKRQREFLCGRYHAHRLIDDMGYSNFEIGRDSKGCPLWPPGLVGSISHTNDYCVVAVSDDSSISSIGIDLEETGRMKEDLWKRLFTDAEISSLGKISQPIEQKRHAAVLFSAKEAFYKYDYPLHQRQYDFTDVEVHIDDSGHDFELSVNGQGYASRLTGRFVSGLTHVLTMIVR